ncbi:MAG: ChaN family lipoprotein [bacterium]
MIAALVTACVNYQANANHIEQHKIHKVTYQKKALSFDSMINNISDKRIVLIGEQHTRFDHHLNQLAVIKALHQRNPQLAIGVEWFQQPFQQVLDDFIAKKIDTATLLRDSEYYQRWKYDYRLYQPIMDYARQHNIRLLALNAPVEITKKVGAKGLASLTPIERQQLPTIINPPSSDYEKALTDVFSHHHLPKARIKNFIMVQRIWDETMAANSAKFINENPNATLVVLAGVGHIAQAEGIPTDIQRKLPNIALVKLMTADKKVSDYYQYADYQMYSKPIELPKTGKMGVMLNTQQEHLVISQIRKGSAADKAQLEAGDKIIKINDMVINNMTDLKIVIGSAKVGEEISLIIQREGKEKKIPVTLQ